MECREQMTTRQPTTLTLRQPGTRQRLETIEIPVLWIAQQHVNLINTSTTNPESTVRYSPCLEQSRKQEATTFVTLITLILEPSVLTQHNLAGQA